MSGLNMRPTSKICHWCESSKRVHNGALICTVCDGPIHLLKVKPR